MPALAILEYPNGAIHVGSPELLRQAAAEFLEEWHGSRRLLVRGRAWSVNGGQRLSLEPLSRAKAEGLGL